MVLNNIWKILEKKISSALIISSYPFTLIGLITNSNNHKLFNGKFKENAEIWTRILTCSNCVNQNSSFLEEDWDVIFNRKPMMSPMIPSKRANFNEKPLLFLLCLCFLSNSWGTKNSKQQETINPQCPLISRYISEKFWD